MKILFVGAFCQHRHDLIYIQALQRLGHTVVQFDYRRVHCSGLSRYAVAKQAVSVAKREKVDVVFIHKGEILDSTIMLDLRKAGIPPVFGWPDAASRINQPIQSIAKAAAACVSPSPVIARKLGGHKRCWFHQGACERTNKPLGLEKTIPLSFIGNVDCVEPHIERNNIMRKLYEVCDIQLFSNSFGVLHNEVVNKSRLNLNMVCTDRSGPSDRISKIILSGGILLTNSWCKMPEEFVNHENCLLWETADDIVELWKTYGKCDAQNIVKNSMEQLYPLFTSETWARNLTKVFEAVT